MVPVVQASAGGGGVVTDREYQRIKLDGYNKRQAGRPITANPYEGKASLRRQADAWAAGWGDANRDIRRRQ